MMLKSAAAMKYHHNKSLKNRPTNAHDWRLMNQIKQTPDIINKRVANIELRRMFLEGQNVRNNANEKMRLQNILAHHNVPWMRSGRFRTPSNVEEQAFRDCVQQLDANPANRSHLQQHPIFQPIIGKQPQYVLT
jgi:hypothetical protein